MRRNAGILILAIALSGCASATAAEKCSAPAIQQAVVRALVHDALMQLPDHFDGPSPSPTALSAEGARLIQTGLLRIKLLTVAEMDKDTGGVVCDAEINFHLTDHDAALVKAAAAAQYNLKPRDTMTLDILAPNSVDHIGARYGVRRDLETNIDRIGQVWDNGQAEGVVAFIVAQRLYEQIRRNQFNVTPGTQEVIPAAPASDASDRRDHIKILPPRTFRQPEFPGPMITPTPDLDPDQ